MLSERQLEALLKIFDERMQEVTNEYLRRMGEHLKAIGQLKATDVHRLTEMKRLNANVNAVQRKIAEAAGKKVEDVEAVFIEVAESDYRFMSKYYGEARQVTIRQNKAIKRILQAQARVTQQEMANLSQTTILSNLYRRAVDTAVQTVQSGLTDYNSAIRSAMKRAAGQGLRVKYPVSGISRRLDTAVRMNVLDGVRALNNDVLWQTGKEFGADGVEISAHALCAEDHLPYQGRQYSLKEFEDIQLRMDRPIGMWNCKHTRFPILLGVSAPTYSEEDLRRLRILSSTRVEIDGQKLTRYQWTQEQRHIETAIRSQKDIAIAAKAAGDDVLRRECQRHINRLDALYQHISERAGLIKQRERMAVSGFHRVSTSK